MIELQSKENTLTNTDVARQLAAIGHRVFPCYGETSDEGNEKRPCRGVFWRDQSSSDAPRIDAWFRRWPNAVPAIDLEKSGLLVIDLDRHDPGADGVAAWEALEREHGAARAPVVKTPSNGRHLYFRNCEPPHGNGRGRLPRGIDVRGAGGYVIAPGATLADGRAYVLDGDLADAPPMPDWLLTLLMKESEAPEEVLSAAPVNASKDEDVRIGSYANEGTRAELDRVRSALKGARNNTLNEAAFAIGQMVGADWLPRSWAEAQLAEAAEAAGLPPGEARATIKSGLDAGEKQPRAPLSNGTASLELSESQSIVPVSRVADPQIPGKSVAVPRTIHPPQKEPARPLRVHDAQAFEQENMPKREWIIQDLIPASEITLLGADGGTGKTQLALQLGYCLAKGVAFLGLENQSCTVLYYGAEDPRSELCYRYKQIQHVLASAGIEPKRFGLISVADDEAELATFDKDGTIKPTHRYEQLAQILSEWKPRLLILDSAADVMGGDEINRRQVRSFFRLLRGLALEHSCAILLLAHPSVDGMKSGRGYSGSTHWNNAARSRLYLTIPTKDDKAVDPDLRQLSLEKSNRAKRGQSIIMRFDDGIFVEQTEQGAFDALTDTLDKQKFLELLEKRNKQNWPVGPNPGPNYAPKLFSDDPGAGGTSKSRFARAMSLLLTEGTIGIAAVGPPSRRKSILVLPNQNAEDDSPHETPMETANSLSADGNANAYH